MPVRHNFKAARIAPRLQAVLTQGTLRIMVQTQTEMQKMVSKPGRGRIYAKTPEGVARLDEYINENVGLNKRNQQRASIGARMHAAFAGQGNFDVNSILSADDQARRSMTREMVARRQGIDIRGMFGDPLKALRGGRRNLRDAGLHRASAPGDPPTVDTGHLRRNIQIARPTRRKTGIALGWRLTIAVKYAAWLEEGTTRMEPRPFARPTLEKMRKVAPRMLRNYLRISGFAFTGLR